MQLVQYSYLAVRLDGCGEHGVAEIVLCHNLRTAECEQDAAWLDALQTFHVKTGVAL